MTMSKLKASIISAVGAAGAAAPLVMQPDVLSTLREENQSLRQQVEGLTAEKDRLSNLLTQASRPGPLRSEERRVGKECRTQSAAHRQETNQPERSRAEKRRPQTTHAEAGQSSQSCE